MNFEGTPLGIDIRKVVETGILPFINTDVEHRWIALKKALKVFAEKYTQWNEVEEIPTRRGLGAITAGPNGAVGEGNRD